MKDIDVLSGGPSVTLSIGASAPVEIRPLKMREIPLFAKAVLPISQELEKLATEGLNPTEILRMIGEHGETVFECVSIASRLDADVVSDMEPDLFVELIEKIVEVNKDFFVQTLFPKIEQILTTMGTAVEVHDTGET